MNYLRVVAIAIFFHIVMNLFMPWWNIFLAGLLAGYFSKLTLPKTFIAIFLALSAYWFVLILRIDNINEHILSARVAEMLDVPGNTLLILLNSFIGGFCAALGSVVGIYLKNWVKELKAKA